MAHPGSHQPVLSPSERQRRNHDEMARTILAASRDVMRERGVADLSLHEVARRVKLRAPSLYQYFSGKMALYDALFQEGLLLFQEYVDRALSTRGSFWERLHLVFESYMMFAQEQPDLYQLLFERPVPGFVPSEKSMELSRGILAAWEETFPPVTEISGLSVHQTRDLLIAMIHGLTSQHLANEPDIPVGSGRYGSLIPAAVDLFQAAWQPKQAAPTHERDTNDQGDQE